MISRSTQVRTSASRAIFALALIVWLASARPAYAYIDPGSGSVMLQVLLGGFAGLVVMFKLVWHRIAERFGLKSRTRRPS